MTNPLDNFNVGLGESSSAQATDLLIPPSSALERGAGRHSALKCCLENPRGGRSVSIESTLFFQRSSCAEDALNYLRHVSRLALSAGMHSKSGNSNLEQVYEKECEYFKYALQNPVLLQTVAAMPPSLAAPLVFGIFKFRDEKHLYNRMQPKTVIEVWTLVVKLLEVVNLYRYYNPHAAIVDQPTQECKKLAQEMLTPKNNQIEKPLNSYIGVTLKFHEEMQKLCKIRDKALVEASEARRRISIGDVQGFYDLKTVIDNAKSAISNQMACIGSYRSLCSLQVSRVHKEQERKTISLNEMVMKVGLPPEVSLAPPTTVPYSMPSNRTITAIFARLDGLKRVHADNRQGNGAPKPPSGKRGVQYRHSLSISGDVNVITTQVLDMDRNWDHARRIDHAEKVSRRNLHRGVTSAQHIGASIVNQRKFVFNDPRTQRFVYCASLKEMDAFLWALQQYPSCRYLEFTGTDLNCVPFATTTYTYKGKTRQTTADLVLITKGGDTTVVEVWSSTGDDGSDGDLGERDVKYKALFNACRGRGIGFEIWVMNHPAPASVVSPARPLKRLFRLSSVAEWEQHKEQLVSMNDTRNNKIL